MLWVEKLLSGILQKVKIGEQFSNLGTVTLGVPQVSVIGSLLILIFINDLQNNLKSGVSLFADDCMIYRQIMKICQYCNSWTLENIMKINGKKNNSNVKHTLINEAESSLGGEVIPRPTSCKYVGIYFNNLVGRRNRRISLSGKRGILYIS